MSGRGALSFFVIALAPLGGAAEPVRLDAAALGTIAIDPDEARAARAANDRLTGGRLLFATDPHRPRGARLDLLRPSPPAGPQATGPGATGAGATGAGAPAMARRGEPVDE